MLALPVMVAVIQWKLARVLPMGSGLSMKLRLVLLNWRELKAVSLVLESFATKLAGHRVKWFTDDQNVVRIVEAGSKKQHLQSIALSIFVTCFRQGIRLDMHGMDSA